MRLIKANKEELQDRNGIKYFSQENFSQIILSDGEIVAGFKKNKEQLYSIGKPAAHKGIYNKITHDTKYWYGYNDKGCTVFDINLKEKLYTVKADEVKLLGNYFSFNTNDGTGIINRTGTIILEPFFEEITSTQNPNIFYIERKEKGAYFNVNTFKFIWQENGFNPAYIADEE